jgi:hypothetical protein
MRAKMYAIANLRYLQHCEMCDTRRYGDYGVEHIEYVVVNISETEQYFLEHHAAEDGDNDVMDVVEVIQIQEEDDEEEHDDGEEDEVLVEELNKKKNKKTKAVECLVKQRKKPVMKAKERDVVGNNVKTASKCKTGCSNDDPSSDDSSDSSDSDQSDTRRRKKPRRNILSQNGKENKRDAN